MRVSKSNPRGGERIRPRRKLKKEAAVYRAFEEVLQFENEEEIDFETALAEIDEYACRLKESPIFGNLLGYKKRVKAVLQFLVRKSYTVSEQSSYDPLGKRRLYLLVEGIDGQLEELTKDFLNNQLSTLELASRLDEIRGLLLDLYS
ncbi:MAG: YaaR family protein [Firmicutes bacterium]|nr:YaaR family protein [Bacillota bacterium]